MQCVAAVHNARLVAVPCCSTMSACTHTHALCVLLDTVTTTAVLPGNDATALCVLCLLTRPLPGTPCRDSRPPSTGSACRFTATLSLAPTSGQRMKQPRSGHSDAGAWPPGAVPEDTSRTLYFARVPPTVPSEEILALFKTCGPVRNLQLYRPWRKARSSKVRAAAAALRHFSVYSAGHSKHTTPVFGRCAGPAVTPNPPPPVSTEQVALHRSPVQVHLLMRLPLAPCPHPPPLLPPPHIARGAAWWSIRMQTGRRLPWNA
jgi:hypothetical protein